MMGFERFCRCFRILPAAFGLFFTSAGELTAAETGAGSVGGADGAKQGRQSAAQRIESLETLAADLEGPLTVSFEIFLPEEPLWPKTGPLTERCRFTSDGTSSALQVHTAYHEIPKYSSPAGRQAQLFYDSNDNLRITRSLLIEGLSSPDMERLHQMSELLTVSPDGQVETTFQQSTPTRTEFCVGTRSAIWAFDQFRLVMGRSLASRFKDVRSDQVMADGRHEVVLDGVLYPGAEGVWRLIFDDNGSILPREFEFVDTDSGRVIQHVELRESIEFDGVHLAKEGVLTYYPGAESSWVAYLTLRDVRRGVEDHLLQGIQARLIAPFDGQTFDLCADTRPSK